MSGCPPVVPNRGWPGGGGGCSSIPLSWTPRSADSLVVAGQTTDKSPPSPTQVTSPEAGCAGPRWGGSNNGSSGATV
jgi:hypothetical protein